jgi:hypothetical protein
VHRDEQLRERRGDPHQRRPARLVECVARWARRIHCAVIAGLNPAIHDDAPVGMLL